MARMIPVGRCGECGGVVSVPEVWAGTQRPPERCEECGAEADPARGLPHLPMKRRPKIEANCTCAGVYGLNGTAVCPVHGFNFLGNLNRSQP